jgi:hypothetical protein
MTVFQNTKKISKNKDYRPLAVFHNVRPIGDRLVLRQHTAVSPVRKSENIQNHWYKVITLHNSLC